MFPRKIAEVWKGFSRDTQNLKGKASTWDIFAVELLQGHIDHANAVMITFSADKYIFFHLESFKFHFPFIKVKLYAHGFFCCCAKDLIKMCVITSSPTPNMIS